MMISVQSLITVLTVIPLSTSFSLIPSVVDKIRLSPSHQRQYHCSEANNCLPRLPSLSLGSEASSSSSSPTEAPNPVNEECATWKEYATFNSIETPKLSVRPPYPSERGKGGVHATSPISALEVIARIPRRLIIAASDLQSSERGMEAAARAKNFSWAVDLTAAALVSLHPNESDVGTDDSRTKRGWIAGWKEGGWATEKSDLGPPEAQWGPSCVTGTLLATGSDNDRNVFAKFRLPSHPVLHRAALGLAMLTGAEDGDCLDALGRRGSAYRGMRDGLAELIGDPSAVEEERKGSLMEGRRWEVADVLSRVLARATMLEIEGEPVSAVVPLHERLGHGADVRGANARLVYSVEEGKKEGDVLLIATRDIEVGEAVTRDYNDAPRLEGDTSEGALLLLLQFGLPPSAWITSTDLDE